MGPLPGDFAMQHVLRVGVGGQDREILGPSIRIAENIADRTHKHHPRSVVLKAASLPLFLRGGQSDKVLGFGDEQSYQELPRTFEWGLLHEDPRGSGRADLGRAGQHGPGLGRASQEADPCPGGPLAHRRLHHHPVIRAARHHRQLRLLHQDVGRGQRAVHEHADQPQEVSKSASGAPQRVHLRQCGQRQHKGLEVPQRLFPAQHLGPPLHRRCHGGTLASIQINQDNVLVSGGDDGSLKFWDW